MLGSREYVGYLLLEIEFHTYIDYNFLIYSIHFQYINFNEQFTYPIHIYLIVDRFEHMLIYEIINSERLTIQNLRS